MGEDPGERFIKERMANLPPETREAINRIVDAGPAGFLKQAEELEALAQARLGEKDEPPAPSGDPCLSAALDWARKVVKVFPLHTPGGDGLCTCGAVPCKSAGKHPRTDHGLNDATIDPETIRAWFHRWPRSNFGIVTGRSFFVVDIDPRNGGSIEALEERVGKLPDTRTHRTGGGGYHILFVIPRGTTIKNREGVLPGVDIKGEGGYIVAPPSLHQSGGRYECITGDTSMMDPPPALLRLIAGDTGGPIRPPLILPGLIRQGERNALLFRTGCSLRGKGLSGTAILAALKVENQAKCSPPLPEDEVERIAGSVVRYPEGKPNGGKKEKTSPEVFPAAFKNDNGAVSPYKVAGYLMQKYTFLTMDDTEEIRIYRAGVYEPNGEAVVETEVERLLGAGASINTTNEVLGHVRRSTLISRDTLDPDPLLLALENGVLDLRTMKLGEHREDLLMTVKVPLSYDPAATCPESEKFWAQIVDPADIPIIKEWFGYVLYRGYPIQKALMLIGDGDNGKSTLISQVRAFLGVKNVSSIELQKLGDRFAAAALYGKLANMFADISSKELKSASFFKMLTSGMDSIPAEYKFKNQFSFVNHAKLIYSCNVLPDIEEDSHAIFKRWSIINFPNQFTGDRQDKTILSRIASPQELSGILNLALKALSDLLKKGSFTGSIKADEMRDKYKRMANPVYAFAVDELEVAADAFLIKRELYACFTNYAHEKGIPAISEKSFHERLPLAVPVRGGRTKVEGRQEHVWYGVRFQAPQDQSDSKGDQKTIS